MSRVLKLHETPQPPSVRSLRSALGGDSRPAPEAAEPADTERLRLDEERSRWLRRVEKQDAEIASLRAQAEAAFQKGETHGREAGRREAADLETKRLAVLKTGVEQAVAALARATSGLEKLAPQLARQGLAGILGTGDDRCALVTAIVRQQLKALDSHAILRIDVSPADFSDEAALAQLAEAAGSSALRLHVDSALKSGDCRIKLTLGTLDLGVDHQWGRLAALLDDLSQTGGGPHG